MRLAVVLSTLALGSVFACSAASIGSLDGSGVDLPDRTDDGDGGNPSNGTGTNATTAVLTVTLAGPGTVTSAPTGLTCTTTACTGTFPIGTSVSLAAEATGGGTFSGWTGACTGATCTVTLTADTAVTATFGALSGTWKGLYENKRPANGCNFDNKGNLTLTTAADGDAGTAVKLTAAMDGLELRGGGCVVNAVTTGTTSMRDEDKATVVAGALTGTWLVDVVGAGNGPLAFPFKSTITGSTMTGQWTCTGCTGTFTLTRQP